MSSPSPYHYSELEEQPISPFTVHSQVSSAQSRDGRSDEMRRKRPRDEGRQMKKPTRRRMACLPCRMRKIKCDNSRPTCATCASGSIECIYIDNIPPPAVDSTTRLILERLDKILTGVNSISPNLKQDTSSNTYYSPSIYDPVQPSEKFDGSRDYLKIPTCKTTADSTLTWPIFGGNYQQDILIGTLFSDEEKVSTDRDNMYQSDGQPSFISDETYQVRGGLQSLPDERIPILIDRFLDCVHTKNPILDVHSLINHGRKAAENGLGWDAHSCLILIACALGCVAFPFGDKNWEVSKTPTMTSNDCSSSIYSRELQLAESCFVLACRRLGTLKHTVIGAQCNFFAGVFLMYTFRPLPAWNHFCQASIFYQIHSKTVSGLNHIEPRHNELNKMSTTQRSMEQSLYWSCFKSECEIRVELPLPQSWIADFEYPHTFPSPPSPPSNITPGVYQSGAQAASVYSQVGPIRAHAKYWNEELSWYYYLTEVALRRISNRIINTFYHADHTSWFDIAPLIPMAEEFETQISNWSANLPIVMQYDSNQSSDAVSPSKELGWATANRLLEMKTWLYRPFLYYAIHSPALLFNAQENQKLRRLVDAAMECNYSIIQNRTLRHRHHGIWFDIRALVTAGVILAAVIKSGNVTIPPDWEDLFTTIINSIKFWEDESCDLKKTRGLLEGLLKESKAFKAADK